MVNQKYSSERLQEEVKTPHGKGVIYAGLVLLLVLSVLFTDWNMGSADPAVTEMTSSSPSAEEILKEEYAKEAEEVREGKETIEYPRIAPERTFLSEKVLSDEDRTIAEFAASVEKHKLEVSAVNGDVHPFYNKDHVHSFLTPEHIKLAIIASKALDGYPLPSVILAQMCVETGWGSGSLFNKSNSLFNIKCIEHTPKTQGNDHCVNHHDDDKDDMFFRYEDKEFSVNHYVEWMRSRKHHTAMKKKKLNDYFTQTQSLQRTGYATSKTYAKDLQRVIEGLGLYSIDDRYKKEF